MHVVVLSQPKARETPALGMLRQVKHVPEGFRDGAAGAHRSENPRMEKRVAGMYTSGCRHPAAK